MTTATPSAHLRAALVRMAYLAQSARIEQATVPPSHCDVDLLSSRRSAVEALRWARLKYGPYDQRFPG